MPQNGGSAEYAILINSLTTTGEKVETVSSLLAEEFAKKIVEEDVNTPVDAAQPPIAGALLAVGGMVAAGTFPMQQPSLLDDIARELNNLKNALNGFKLQVPQIKLGGLGGLVQWAKGAGAVLGRLCGVVGIVATIIFGLLELYKIVSDKVTEIDNKFIALQVDYNLLKKSHERQAQKIQLLETGLITTEAIAQNAIKIYN